MAVQAVTIRAALDQLRLGGHGPDGADRGCDYHPPRCYGEDGPDDGDGHPCHACQAYELLAVLEHEARIYTELTDLTASERRLYDALYAADGALVPERDLLAALFGEREYDQGQRHEVKTYIYRLRRLGVQITNVKGVGYQLGSTRCPTCAASRR